MALSIIVGDCWQRAAQSISGFLPLPEGRAAMVGMRDLDEPEEIRLKESQIKLVRYEEIHDNGVAETLNPVLDELSKDAEGIYLHIDLDVLDPDFAPVNPYQPAGGLAPEALQQIIQKVAIKLPIVGASVTAYDPEMEPENKALTVGLELISLIGKLTC